MENQESNYAKQVANVLQHHRSIKASNQTYPALPRSVKNSADLEKTVKNMSFEQLSHLDSCLVGFFKRVHNWENHLKFQEVPIKQEDEEVIAKPLTEGTLWS